MDNYDYAVVEILLTEEKADAIMKYLRERIITPGIEFSKSKYPGSLEALGEQMYQIIAKSKNRISGQLLAEMQTMAGAVSWTLNQLEDEGMW